MALPMTKNTRPLLLALGLLLCFACPGFAQSAWTPLPVANDPLMRMPGTQPGQVSLEGANRCLNCHADFPDHPPNEPGFYWKGSMMAQAGRDFLYWTCLGVAAQDSIWAIGRPNATDICLRCHMPLGWLQGRSDPTNGSAMTGDDFDGVQCDFCHKMFDPFFKTTYNGTREGNEWLNYWDETNASSTPSQAAATDTRDVDISEALTHLLFNGNNFFANNEPVSAGYTENADGQYFVSGDNAKRASFADANAKHQIHYSRHHKSKYMCGTCHDVSNPVLENLAFAGTTPGDGSTVLPTEQNSAYSYYHVERTFSEFMLSDYGLQGGAAGLGPFAPTAFTTSLSNNYIARCQDCHMNDVTGVACNKTGAINRPAGSTEHPNSGVPEHDLTGGNVWVSYVLASSVQGSPNYDATNDQLLNQGSAVLTLDMSAGQGPDPAALLAGVDRAKSMLDRAAAIENLVYFTDSGSISFRIQNQAAHKLISGFPEGRRMFVNIKAYAGGSLIYEVNPYDATVGTLKGLPGSASSPALGPNEAYVDKLVYEVHPSSTLTGEDQTFHFVLATGRYKDNRIPPKGFRIGEAAARHSEPAWQGQIDPNYFTPEEYAGGYDDVSLSIAPGADSIEVRLYYQTTSREYIEFLRDEIAGTGGTLSSPTHSGLPQAYIVQTDPFFDQLRAWGPTLWQLWDHNKNVAGAAPYLMTQALDSDGDGLQDESETNTGVYHSPTDTGSDPAVFDTDGDGLSDGKEVHVYGTNPVVADTDGDGYSDGAEVAAGTDPKDPASNPGNTIPALNFLGVALFLVILGAGYRVVRRPRQVQPRN